MTARCKRLTTTGERCREQRPAWLWLVQEGGRLDWCCTAHLRDGQLHRVSAVAVLEWMCRE